MKVILALLALSLAAGCESAPPTASQTPASTAFADSDGDGIPDTRAGSAPASTDFVDRDGDGIPDTRTAQPR